LSPRPLIFISAVSQELRSARQLVANTLTFLGYDPIWQDIFETSEGDLPGVLRKQISRCNGVVQLVGCCYGAEPPQPTEEFGRVSYTQYEAFYARKIGKKVWYLFLDEHFPSDACVDEPDELRSLQTAYRNRLKADTHLYHPLTSLEGVEASVLKLRGDLMQLRKGVKRWAAGVAILLLIGLAVNFWLLQSQRHTSQQITSVNEQMTKISEGIVQYIQIEGRIREAQTESGSVRDQVYEQLSKQMNINVGLLREKLPQAAEQLKDAPTASLFERASAAYVTNDYREAERWAVQAAVQARNAKPTNNPDVIRALKLAGFAAQKQIKYATAMAHLREAAELTNREGDPGQWAEIQHAIADVLIDQGQYREAATVLQGALEARASAFGPEHPDTLRSRNRLAYALWRQGRYRDAEGEFRRLIAVEERLLGAQHPETLASENGLANALDDEGKHGDAESEHRHVLELRSKVLGPENPETLKSRNNLALALNRQQKYAEAETLFRELITVEERVLGPEHPETLRSRRNLLVAVGNQGRHAEAETGFRDLLAVQERLLGPEHPDTSGVRNNIGFALAQQARFADAEAQFREVIKIEAKVLGAEHPATLSSRIALAGVLGHQEKYAEANAECREGIALEEKVLGPEHPTTISSWYAFAYQLARQNKTEEALQFARRAASGAEQTFGKDHPDTRKYAELVQQLQSQRPGVDQASSEQSSNKNKDEVSPESIAEAFVQAYSGPDVDALAGLYADRVDYTNSGVISNAAVRAEVKEYFTRWPERRWSLVGPVKTVSLGAIKQKVIFSASYDASDPQTNRHASGIAQETLILATDANGAMKIVSQEEQLSKRNSSRSDEETSDAQASPKKDFEAAKQEYEQSSHDETARVAYVTKLAQLKVQLLKVPNEQVDLKGAINSECQKHPYPKDVDSKKLRQLIVGKWASPRHHYVYLANGKCGMEGGRLGDGWQIQGNQLNPGDRFGGPIILLTQEYFIYSVPNPGGGSDVMFHSRVRE
jgi:tetratricopeptide (TPR) repeat protein